jgi:capsule polysaccharide export protein KpsE/RkpR
MEAKTSYNTTNLFHVLMRWKKSIFTVALATGVLAFIATLPFFIAPKFKSFAIMYPVNLASYSIESETEQLQQLLKSEDIREELIKDFGLYQHYDIDSTKKSSRFFLMQDLNANIQVSKTDFESVELSILDTDPVFAKKMVDSVIVKANRVHKKVYRQRQTESMLTAETMYNAKKIEVDTLDAALKALRINTGIFDMAEQTKGLSRVYYQALVDGKAGKGSKIDEVHDNFKQFTGDYVMLNEKLTRARTVMFDYRQYYENAFKDVNKEFSITNVVTLPQVADKKTYPIRWLIMLAAVASVTFLFFVGVVVFENTNKKMV